MMKKTILTLAFVASSAFAWAQQTVKLKSGNVNLYRQPSPTSEVVKVVSKNDEMLVVRKFNDEWSIVTVGTETGYIETYRLPKMKKQIAAKE